MKMLVEVSHTTLQSIMAEAMQRKLPFEKIVAERIRREVDQRAMPRSERIAKNESTIEEHFPLVGGVPARPKKVPGKTRDFQELRKGLRVSNTLPNSFRVNDKDVQHIRERGRVLISDLYALVDETNQKTCVGKHFSLETLYKSFPMDIYDMITPNQKRGWPAVFHAYMKDRIHVDYDNSFRPIRYWRTRLD